MLGTWIVPRYSHTKNHKGIEATHAVDRRKFLLEKHVSTNHPSSTAITKSPFSGNVMLVKRDFLMQCASGQPCYLLRFPSAQLGVLLVKGKVRIVSGRTVHRLECNCSQRLLQEHRAQRDCCLFYIHCCCCDPLGLGTGCYHRSTDSGFPLFK